MKSKNTIFVVGLISLLGISLYLRFQEERVETTLIHSKIESTTIDDLERSLPQNFDLKDEFVSNSISDHELWPKLRNYAHSNEFIFLQPTESIDLIRKVISEVSKCLKTNLCKQKRLQNEKYFDKEHTPAHNLIERSLSLLINMKEEKVYEYSNITKEQLIGLLDIRNETIQGLALELILTKELSTSDENYLLKKLSTFHQDTAAAAYGMLFEKFKNNNDLKDQIFNNLKQDLKSTDQNRAIKVAKLIKEFGLNDKELTELMEINCENKNGKANKKAIEHYLKQSNNSLHCS